MLCVLQGCNTLEVVRHAVQGKPAVLTVMLKDCEEVINIYTTGCEGQTISEEELMEYLHLLLPPARPSLIRFNVLTVEVVPHLPTFAHSIG